MEFLLGVVVGVAVGAAFSKVWISLWEKAKAGVKGLFDKD